MTDCRSRQGERPVSYWTVSVTDPEAPFDCAVMVVCPVVSSVASPVVLAMLATAELEELQAGLTKLLFVSVAVKVTEPELNRAVNVPVPCPEVQPVAHVIVNSLLL